MRLPNSAHTSQPWRIHELASDFKVEDVWALPTPGGPDGLDELVRQMTSGDGAHNANPVVRALFAIRWRLGSLLGWDKADTGLGNRVPSLRDRLPADLREGPRGPDFRAAPFTAVYRTDNEYVAELANKTVHVLMHVGWVKDPAGGYRGQMAALVKPNGLFGTAYMAAIKPVRVAVVYPRLMRSIERRWQRQAAG
ncbi:DUF2867 domain-containing protein [Streptomyces sp. LX-29]|uniref:DUF2867 domain-containing protein n=1 Tax=Streptomyces sp. LX-29 TaxID=2900152 RepID=UPI00240E6F03|nr:DUF2867 domain-containing protein [Streptomyces sp. LX-29]WFB10861.1 DUF2867 domain-containing protein [Streptomyces sp. LX-29]